MIIGKKEELKAYKGISANLDKGIDYVLSFDKNTPDGRVEIDGNKVYALISTGQTKGEQSDKYEAHKKYIDLQFVLEGEEDTGYASIDNCEVDTPYDEGGDFMMVKGPGSEITTKANEFYIAFPFDGHRPLHSKNPGKIRKLIVKVLV